MKLLIISLCTIIYFIYTYGILTSIINTIGLVIPVCMLIYDIDNLSYKISFDSNVFFYHRYHTLIDNAFEISGKCIILINNIIIHLCFNEFIPKTQFTYTLLLLYYCINFHLASPNSVYYRYIHGDALMILNRNNWQQIYYDYFNVLYYIILHPSDIFISIKSALINYFALFSKYNPIVIKYRNHYFIPNDDTKIANY